MAKTRADKVVKAMQIVLLIFFAAWFVSWFSIKAERRGEFDRNIAERTVVALRDAPRTVEEFLRLAAGGKEHQEIVLDKETDALALGSLNEIEAVPENLYLLHYRFEGGNSGTVFLQNIKNGEVAKSWTIPLSEVFQDLQETKLQIRNYRKENKSSLSLDEHRVANTLAAIQINSPWMMDNGDLLFNCGSLGPTYRIDGEGKVCWRSKEMTHHSIEVDHNGDIWTCALNLDNSTAIENDFREDAVLCLSPEGKTKEYYSITDILKKNGLFTSLVASAPAYRQEYGRDPYHLNDVLPVPSDGPFWKTGDLFLSMRQKNLVMQFRPLDQTVRWHQQGPWLTQHDISILNESQIAIFNNNAWLLNNAMSAEGSNIAVFDFQDQTTKFTDQGWFATKTEGRQARTPDGLLLVEETNQGIYMLINEDEQLVCRFYIPYHSDNTNAMNPTWGRFYLREGDSFQVQD